MRLIRRKIEHVMTEGSVDTRPFSSPLECMLYACSRVYELAIRLRLSLYDKGLLKQKSLPCKVVCIGNITVGGSGKTPLVHYVANLLKSIGLEVAIISRGYGGYGQRSGGIVSDGKTILMGREASGDEPQLLASKLTGVPLLVGKDRYRAGRWAISRFGTSVLILDDGFQHLSLKRDLDLLLMDSARPLGNGFCIPRGTLREPIEQIDRATALVLTRSTGVTGSTQEPSIVEACSHRHPIFRCVHVPEKLYLAGPEKSLDLASLKGKRLFAFSGIARNDSFRETITQLGGSLAGFLEFPDHHRYSSRDLRVIWKKSRELNVDNIITTEKDQVNISTDIPSTPQLLVLAVSISFGDHAQRFDNYIKNWAMSP